MKLFLLAGLLSPTLFAQSLTGLWDATVVSGGVTVPFRMEFKSEGAPGQAQTVQAWFFNGEDRFVSNSGRFENGKLSVHFDHIAAVLDATYKGGVLDGMYAGKGRTGKLPFHAEPAKPQPAASANAPNIDGEWEIQQVKSGKGESAWRFLVRQNGSDLSATVLRVDGDTGLLAGSYRDGKFVLSHFSGARAMLMSVEPKSDGTLAITMNKNTQYAAMRPAEARARGLAPPTDPEQHTGVQNPSEPFHFAFRDLNGKLVSEENFRGKVVIVSILGSWCPNCHDEAPYLVELYKKYHAKGLEIVGLSFEEEDQLQDPERLRAFVQSYGIPYPMLVCGEPGEISQKLPQLKAFDAWPTVLFLGRDGRARLVHAGFPSAGSGPVFTQAKRDFAANVERLLAENAR
ncbi:MAG TPA: TlpA disulfide reductase family protein [Bryobacteraceae bacterium]|nr:TlpA disulfide reductase family protein [Bryobacteraceae bacterium]